MAADALRSAMLAIGGVHLRFCHDPPDHQGALRLFRTAKKRVLRLLRKATEGADGCQPKYLSEGEVELVLATLLSCILASVCISPAEYETEMTFAGIAESSG